MERPAAPTLMNLAGMPGMGGDPHLQPGNHLRLSHHPMLGLPVGPIVLQRANAKGLPDDFALRRDAVFLDDQDRVLTLPVTVAKGHTVRVVIPQGPDATCIWVGLMTAAPQKPDPERPDPEPQRPVFTRPIRPVIVPDLQAVLRPLNRDRIAALLAGRDLTAATGDGSLVMRAFGNAMGGPLAVLAERHAAPYAAAAPGIVELALTGEGTVIGLGWLAAQDLGRFNWDTIDLMHLPRDNGLRYLSVTGANARAEDQVARQAPRRRPLHEISAPTPPAAAPTWTTTEEKSRVLTLGGPLHDDLQALIDGPEPPLTASQDLTVTDASGRPLAREPSDVSTLTVGHLFRVLQAGLDPGVAGWLGFKALDDALASEGLSFYRAVAFFRHPLSIGATRDQIGASTVQSDLMRLDATDRGLDEKTVFLTIQKLAGNLLAAEGRTVTGQLEPARDYLRLAAFAVVDRTAPPRPPQPPRMLAPEHVAWMPEPPPTARREIACPVHGILPAATLAFHRTQPQGGTTRLLNPAAGSGWHRPLVLGLPGSDDGVPLIQIPRRQGSLADRNAGPDAARYHLAQQDRFGRWSAPSARDAAAGVRPAPPIPLLHGSYLPPDRDEADSKGGTLRLFVPLPEANSLAPASLPLTGVTLRFRHHPDSDPLAQLALPDVTVPIGAARDYGPARRPGDPPPPRALPAVVTGPVLARTERRRMIVTAVWNIAGGAPSDPSLPLRLAMTDPRPPDQMTIPETLLYSPRPDATGLAWVEREWTVTPGSPVDHAVYYTDEVRLVSWLAANGRDALARQIRDQPDRLQRAIMLRAEQARFPDHLFERLTGVIDDPAPGRRRFRHAVSGSSRVLNAYRIATEAAQSGARPDLSGLDMVFYAVPNSDPPPRPSVTVRMVAPDAGDQGAPLVAEVSVTVEPGVTPARTLRLHRTRGGPVDPLSAPVVAMLPVPVPVAGQPRQTVVFRDIGTALIAPDARLSPYAPYRWFAMAQGAPEAGSTVPGMFSAPSDPAGLNATPPAIEDAPRLIGMTGPAVPGGRQDLVLTVGHRLGLLPTAQGRWSWQMLRAAPGAEFAVMAQGQVLTDPLSIADTDAFTPLATRFRLRLTDPLGRIAPVLEVTVT